MLEEVNDHYFVMKYEIYDVIIKDRRLTVRGVASVCDINMSLIFNILTENSKWHSSLFDS